MAAKAPALDNSNYNHVTAIVIATTITSEHMHSNPHRLRLDQVLTHPLDPYI